MTDPSLPPADLAAEFEKAQVEVKKLKKTPAPDELLQLYGLYKQATSGEVTGSRPGMLDFKGRAKYDAWAKRKGQPKESCMRGYIDLVKELAQRYGA